MNPHTIHFGSTVKCTYGIESLIVCPSKMWVIVFTILALSVNTLHCCKTGNERENIKVKNEESTILDAINDTQLIVLGGYEGDLKQVEGWKEHDYEDENQQQENLQLWEQNFNLNEDSLLKKVENNLQKEIVVDDGKNQQKFETLKSYMSKNCLKDFDIFLSMNHEDEWEKYHNEIMQLETQYRKWEKSESDNEWEDITKPKWVVPPM